jgi:hypothetical protein
MIDPSRLVHDLKTRPAPFEAVLDGSKVHEVRVDDRDFAVGDALRLREYDPEAQRYLGRELLATVTHITRAPFVPVGLCVMSIRPIIPIALCAICALSIADAEEP